MLDQNVPNPLAKNPSFHTHKVFAAIGIILIVLIIVVGGIWYLVQSAQDKAGVIDDNTIIKTATSSAKTATTSATKDETSDWKTFVNKTHNYSIKYPSNWIAGDYLGHGTGVEPIEIYPTGVNLQSQSTEFITVTVTANSSCQGDQKINSNGINGFKTKGTLYQDKSLYSCLVKDNGVVSFSLRDKDYSKETVFDLIVSTFKFL